MRNRHISLHFKLKFKLQFMLLMRLSYFIISLNNDARILSSSSLISVF